MQPESRYLVQHRIKRLINIVESKQRQICFHFEVLYSSLHRTAMQWGVEFNTRMAMTVILTFVI